MPYIKTESVKQIREELKRALPEFKLSVVREHHSSVNVSIMAGSVDFGGDHLDINQYWYKDHYKDNPEVLKVIETILNTIYKVETPRELVNDSDYGSVPTFYINISVGKWDRKYIKH